jgi:hypothetical protein
VTPRPSPVPSRGRTVDPAWLASPALLKQEPKTARPSPAPTGLSEAILRWLDQAA